jgi:radical SAM protein with 4Fe4S-binding SPASM domain
MTLNEKITELQSQYDVLAVIDLDPWHDLNIYNKKPWMIKTVQSVHRDYYDTTQRILFTMSRGDIYEDVEQSAGQLLTQLQHRLNDIDISNFFVILLTNDVTVRNAYTANYQSLSKDSVPFTIEVYTVEHTDRRPQDKMTKNIKPGSYQYNYLGPMRVDIEDLTEQEQFLLTKSSTFCMYPWMHFHAYPTGAAYPCCQADMEFSIGDMRKNTIKEIWNQEPIKKIRNQMLNEQSVSACNRCYEQESAGFVSGRMSANKHHGHLINRVHETEPDGTLDRFELTYWDIRFSNLCNLSCRSCGHIFSSSWYKDQAKLAGPDWKKTHKVLNYAGRFETDAWDQLVDHIEHVEQIYFAGGEPLLMEEHYKILDELVRQKKFNVRLIYNTNFTHTNLKDKSVFEYWKLFDSVSVGASLDASGARGEYIRKGTSWTVVEQNRRKMIEICPAVDFYISPTLSIMNALHLPDFHKDWVAKGLIRAQDLNVNILQDPAHYRIDIAPAEYKGILLARYREHIEWLRGQDPLQRATVGFESAITYMTATDNTHLLDTFWRKTHELDGIRNERMLDIIPELSALR